MEDQFSVIDQKVSNFENYIDQLISGNGTALDENNNIIISEDAKDSFTQKKEEFFMDVHLFQSADLFLGIGQMEKSVLNVILSWL